ncbi:hypothetical protein GCM10009841_08600 [Microlunatus panaciterrae]|uniref:SAM-dependent methyltransferase n=1 Tax=Microlunatus panaciterrae TaxID=400768 RepID=A0ABS2RK73_9ACTN|nr:class I SAM-dependent methyltransferase [Microlunatus panaciterrae]MBM7799405.1 SAM-dependent methyltransferase [Microlunatus panaciterrae]
MDASSWDERYAAAAQSNARVWSDTPNQTVARLLGSTSPGTGIDLGAGEGRNALWLASRGWRMTAVDFSARGLETGRRAAQQQGLTVRWVTADARSWRPDGPVDLVLVAYLHLPRSETGPLLGRLASWLLPGGRLIILGHDADNLTRGVGGPQDPDVLYDTRLLADAAHGLVIDQCTQIERQVTADGEPRTAVDTLLVAHAPGSSSVP